MLWETISQVCIFVFGVGALILIDRKNKWGFVLGLLSQPFWYITAYIHEQWGILLVSIAYTISWGYGIYEWFYAKK